MRLSMLLYSIIQFFLFLQPAIPILINLISVYNKRYQSLLKTIFFVFRKWIKCFAQKYKQNRAIIVRLLPYIISILILKHISLNAIYVSIFLILLMLFITFISSKIQNKKSFVKYSRRKADYSRTAEIIRGLSVSFTDVLHFPAQK